MKHLFLAAIIFVLSSLHTNAATLTVANTNDSGAGSLRQAINDAAPGDTINFSVAGTITLTSGQLVIDKNLTIQGPGANLLSISGNNASRAFYINSGVTAVLDGMTIRNGLVAGDGAAGSGGGIYNGGTLSVINSTISGNKASYGGGGLASYNSQGLTVSSSKISSNTAELAGGGVWNVDGVMDVSNSTVTGNIATGNVSQGGQGGGVYSMGSVVSINNSTISGNTIGAGSSHGGGGILSFSWMTVNNSTIAGNTASHGGGVANYGALTFNKSAVTGNIATGDNNSLGQGGGVFNSFSTLIANDSTISDNTAAHSGGGIYNTKYYYCDDDGNCGYYYGRVDASNCTISNNTGGGIWADGVETLSNTIIAGNTVDIVAVIETASHNLIGDAASSGGIVNGVNGNRVGVNPLLGPLGDNGGPTFTHALLSGSPAINAGDNCVLTENGCGYEHPALPTDQRGLPRNRTVDIGSFERQNVEISSSAPFDFDGDGRSDVSVFRPSDRAWYLDRSTQGFTSIQFGLSTDKIVPADYDGDGKTDIAIFRDGTWWRINSINSTVTVAQFGITGDIPLPGDYNGDGRDELAVYRGGEWWIEGRARTDFGIPTDMPVPADYDGDGKTDISIYRGGVWWRINSGNSTVSVEHFGIATDRPVVGDYDGDSKADLAVYRDGTWWILRSQDSIPSATRWGISTDIPVPADYDGDGRTDLAVYRDGQWWMMKSSGSISVQPFGSAGDKPIPASYFP